MYKKILVITLAVIMMTLNYYIGIFEIKYMFESFQIDSEVLVISKIIDDKYNLNNNEFGLQRLRVDKEIIYGEIYDYLEKNEDDLQTINYESNVGLQGMIFSFMYNSLHIPVDVQKCLCAFLTAIVIVAICYLLKEKYNYAFGITFYIIFLLSPWITCFAKNLYWVEFTWFLPLLLCLLLSKTGKYKIYIPLIYISVLVKSLCGYEYLSTILIFSVSFLVADLLTNKLERKSIMKMILAVGIVSILAFITAFTIHSLIRGNGNIIEGAKVIYTEDISRRTIIGEDNSSITKEKNVSNEKTVIETIQMYFNFYTDIIYGITGKAFIGLIIISIIILLFNVYKKRETAIRDVILYFMFLLATLSWLILAKNHSYEHTSLNYVLWYFGYIQMCFYLIVKFIIDTYKIVRTKKNIKLIEETR